MRRLIRSSWIRTIPREHFGIERIVGNDLKAPEESGRKNLEQLGAKRRRKSLGGRLGLLVLAQPHDQVRTDVRRQKDDRVLEVDVPAFTVVHESLVEDLEEHLVDVRVRFFDLVEEHHGIRSPAHRLSKDTALAVSDVAGAERP